MKVTNTFNSNNFSFLYLIDGNSVQISHISFPPTSTHKQKNFFPLVVLTLTDIQNDYESGCIINTVVMSFLNL